MTAAQAALPAAQAAVAGAEVRATLQTVTSGGLGLRAEVGMRAFRSSKLRAFGLLTGLLFTHGYQAHNEYMNCYWLYNNSDFYRYLSDGSQVLIPKGTKLNQVLWDGETPVIWQSDFYPVMAGSTVCGN